MAWPTATCVFGVLQMQSWYTSLRVIQPCLLAEKNTRVMGKQSEIKGKVLGGSSQLVSS